MKVIKGFFCIKESKNYKKGDVYTGSRTDLNDYLEVKPIKKRATKEDKKALITKKNAIETK
ncbi:hypothetical protein N9928_01840 [bacterium]|nr:hypothetical protein [bacterium]